MVEKKMIELLSSGDFPKNEIVNLLKTYLNDSENLQKALNDVTIVSSQQSVRSDSNISLVRIFLQIPDLQKPISDHLLQKLISAVLIAWAIYIYVVFYLKIMNDSEITTTEIPMIIWLQRFHRRCTLGSSSSSSISLPRNNRGYRISHNETRRASGEFSYLVYTRTHTLSSGYRDRRSTSRDRRNADQTHGNPDRSYECHSRMHREFDSRKGIPGGTSGKSSNYAEK